VRYREKDPITVFLTCFQGLLPIVLLTAKESEEARVEGLVRRTYSSTLGVRLTWSNSAFRRWWVSCEPHHNNAMLTYSAWSYMCKPFAVSLFRESVSVVFQGLLGERAHRACSFANATRKTPCRAWRDVQVRRETTPALFFHTYLLLLSVRTWELQVLSDFSPVGIIRATGDGRWVVYKAVARALCLYQTQVSNMVWSANFSSHEHR